MLSTTGDPGNRDLIPLVLIIGGAVCLVFAVISQIYFPFLP